MINIIQNLKTDNIFNNYDIIKEESLKYHIKDKISDLENIIFNQNLVIITSVLNCVNTPLSYYHTRSIFSVKERYKHTLKSIETIKKNIPNVQIMICECSDLSNYESYESDIRNKVNYYYNFYNISDIREAVESRFKGLGEAKIMIKALDIVKDRRECLYKNIFKLSGRYYLNQNFKYEMFDTKKSNFTYWDNSIYSFCTIFYKIHVDDISAFKIALHNSLNELYNNNSIEQCLYKYFNKYVKTCEKMNVSGFLATEGYLFSV